MVDRVYRSCLVSLAGYDTWVDLIILEMVDFDVILGMDCLSPYHTVLDCNAKTVTLAMPGVPPDRDIDFAIDLEAGTKPISIPPYRMSPES